MTDHTPGRNDEPVRYLIQRLFSRTPHARRNHALRRDCARSALNRAHEPSLSRARRVSSHTYAKALISTLLPLDPNIRIGFQVDTFRSPCATAFGWTFTGAMSIAFIKRSY
jgi:hypothetical protein